MNVFIGISGLLCMAVSLVTVLVCAIMKKPKKKPAIALAVGFLMFVMGGVMSVNKPSEANPESISTVASTNSEQVKVEPTAADKKQIEQERAASYKKLNRYDWGSVVAPVLEELGVENFTRIKESKSEHGGQVLSADVEIETESRTLSITVSAMLKELDEKDKPVYEWRVMWIRDADNRDVYYYNAPERDGKPTADLCDYKTGEVITAADPEAKQQLEEAMDEYVNELQTSAQKKQDYDLEVSIEELTTDYYNNVLNGNKKYFGKQVKITGSIKDILFDEKGTLSVIGEFLVTGKEEISAGHPVVYVTDDDAYYYIYCDFENGSYDTLADYVKGDTITIIGTVGELVGTSIKFKECRIIE